MVGHLTSPHFLSLIEDDDMSLHHPHNTPLHIEVIIHKTCVKCVLRDEGVGLNIFTLCLVCALGYSKDAIKPRKRITIKGYDEEEHSFKGIVVFLIRVGPM